ncbi:MAG: 2Fe-2S iron-sulfur cluster-binding protein [Bacteroidota bacterium]
MLKLKINNIEITVPLGTSILKAAEKAGFDIPTMCFFESVQNHASCMVCAVKNNKTGEFVPSCETKAQDGMDICSNSVEVDEFRKDALELLLSDHVGDCEAPCRISCPANMNIPQMNRLIAQDKFTEALEIVKEDIALPLLLGYICSAPCENACRRNQLESEVSICQLKKIVALDNHKTGVDYFPKKNISTNKKIAIIGAGMSGLSACFHLLKLGYSCTIFDKNEKAGGALLTVSETILPIEVLTIEIEIIKQFGAEFKFNTKVRYDDISANYDAILLATGENSNESNIEIYEDTYTTNEQGVFACGSIIRPIKMAVKVVAQGKAAAYSIHSFLLGNIPQKQSKLFNSRFGKLNENEITEYIKESKSAEKTVPSNGIIDGFNKEEAIREASRCLRCDCRKSTTCKLRLYADKYKANQQKYKFGDRKSVRKYFQNDILVFEPEKCIKCGLCIEIANRNKELTGFAYIGRGFDMHIDIPFNKTLEKAIANAASDCIVACPTGALSSFFGEVEINSVEI